MQTLICFEQGAKVGSWVVLHLEDPPKRFPSGSPIRRYLCRCKCGNEAFVPARDLKNGNSTQCSACKKNPLNVKAGETYGSLTAIQKMGDKWLCRCICGEEYLVRQYKLVREPRKCDGSSCRKTKIDWSSEIAIVKLTQAVATSVAWVEAMEKFGIKRGGGSQKKFQEVVATLHLDTSHINQPIDLLGQKFGKLLVKERCEKNDDQRWWLCQCDCGEMVSRTTGQLNCGRGLQCTKCGNETGGEKSSIEFTGQIFGKLTVLKLEQPRRRRPDGSLDVRYWVCRCECGKEVAISAVMFTPSCQDKYVTGSKMCAECAAKEAFEDLTGQRFGCRTVIGLDPELVNHPYDDRGRRIRRWVCVCDCGQAQILDGRVKETVGCIRCANNSHFLKAGQRSGTFSIIERDEEPDQYPGGYRIRRWICKCDCGETVKKTAYQFLQETTGCKKCAPPGNILPPGVAAARVYFMSYVVHAFERGISFELTEEQTLQIMQNSCFYCNKAPKARGASNLNGQFICNGLDRVDNDQSYRVDNVVPACEVCNFAKATLTLEEFEDWVCRIVRHNYHLGYYSEILKEYIENNNYHEASSFSLTNETQADFLRQKFNSYAGNATYRNLSFELSFEECLKLFGGCCNYCGAFPTAPPKKEIDINVNGIDRMNNDLGYHIQNVVSCCWPCNRGKSAYSAHEFLMWAFQVTLHRKLLTREPLPVLQEVY